MPSSTRFNWADYFFEFAELASKRSTCLRRKVGAVLVKDNMVVATGYNGPPRGVRHCSDVGCIRAEGNIPSGERHELCRGLHAEQNVIIQAARCGININGADLYCLNRPCAICTKMIINAGISNVYFIDDYNDALGTKLAKESRVKFRKIKKKK